MGFCRAFKMWWKNLPYICHVKDGVVVIGIRPGRKRWFMFMADDVLDAMKAVE